MTGMYKNSGDRNVDLIKANANCVIRFVLKEGKLTMPDTTPLEEIVMREDQAEAMARLSIDLAMRHVPK